MKFQTKHIAKSFGEKEVLTDVSFSLESGDIKVLMGTNGSGKTTLYNIITGFLKQDAGSIYIDGKAIKNHRPHEINRLGIGRTFQDMRLIGNLTVAENVMLAFSGQKGENWWRVLTPGKAINKEQEENKAKAKEILEKCFIGDVALSMANEISYGQQKLLNLACCMANDADVLLLDEPVAGVNPAYRDKLTGIVKNLKRQGKSILIIEHNTDFIEKVADKVLFLNEGQVKAFEDYASLKNDNYVQEAYI